MEWKGYTLRIAPGKEHRSFHRRRRRRRWAGGVHHHPFSWLGGVLSK